MLSWKLRNVLIVAMVTSLLQNTVGISGYQDL